MDIWQIISLALIQGLTEFLPISSSAHLVLLAKFGAWPDQGLAFDVALHLGSLGAVLWYFRRDLGPLWRGWLDSLHSGRQNRESRLVWAVGFGTVPVGLAGLLLGDYADTTLRSVSVIAWATLGFGILLWLADSRGRRERDEYSLNWRDVLVVGGAQALALIPGVSRSGVTMTAGLLLGLDRRATARFSFLLSIPVIVLAGGLESIKLLRHGIDTAWGDLALGAALSGLSAYLCISLFVRFLERSGMLPFALYRVVLGLVLLMWF